MLFIYYKYMKKNINKTNILFIFVKNLIMSNDKYIPIIGNKLISERAKQRLSRRELGERAGVDLSTIQNIENYNRVPTLTVLIKLADSLNLDLKEFLDE